MKRTLYTLASLVALAGTGNAEIHSDVVINENETATYGYTNIGSESTHGSLINNGVVNANQIYIYDGYLVNNGTMNDVPDEDDEECYDFMSLAGTATGGYIENNGTINGRLFIYEGTRLTLNDGSYTAATEILGGTLYANGNVQTEYMYLEDASEVVMTLDSSIDLMGGGLAFYDVKIVLLVDLAITNGDTTTDFSFLDKNDLFVNFVNDSWESDGFTGDTLITLRDEQGNETTRKYSKLSESIPEPSTATLSLLALAAMAARRRRS